ncbi:RagB/SusD family nutrient uptake outer membrane protein [Chitinophaga sp. OAE865]|uniref:RagB/SusD family nutrient uptake outer membrane protein n=1 Tax=Chitinophaga sp. OAE865 TaxID=2817898 RepID=UPI001AE822EE
MKSQYKLSGKALFVRRYALLCGFLAIAMVFLGSCKNNLVEVPYSFLGEENSFKTASDATVALDAVYDRLRNIYNMTMINLADVNSEELTVQSNVGASILELDNNLYSPSNPSFDAFYTNCYLTIDRANRVIKNVPGITMDATAKAQIIGEAKFLRALIYFDLVQAFGDVPLVTAPTSDVVNVSLKRTPVDAVYAQIIGDLKDAVAANLPAQYTTPGTVGRATSGAAKSLLAKVYLTRKDYVNAAAVAREVIDSKAYSLFPNYKDIFPPENRNGREHIFSAQYSCIKTSYGSTMAESFAIYFSYPINQGGGAYQADSNYVKSYLPGDYRKKVTIITEKVNPANNTLVLSRTGPAVDKYWDPSPCAEFAARNNFMILRYADVLLIYAEAINEINGPTADAYDAINQVRTRARNGNLSANPQNLAGLSQAQFRDAVLEERGWELCFEGHRRWDLLRTGKYINTLRSAGIPVSQKNLLYPIPQHQIDVNEALTQNPGY